MKACNHCSAPLTRNRYPSGKLEKNTHYRHRQYCSKECRAAARLQTPLADGRTCNHCDAPLERKRRPNGRLESRTDYQRRRYCGPACAARDKTGMMHNELQDAPPQEYRNAQDALRDALLAHPDLARAFGEGFVDSWYPFTLTTGRAA